MVAQSHVPPVVTATPLPPQPHTPLPQSLPQLQVFDPLENWDRLPDGDTNKVIITSKVYTAMGQLAFPVDWACEPAGGSRKGDPEASTEAEGRVSRRKCLGIFQCEKGHITRPGVRKAGRDKQTHCRAVPSCNCTLIPIACEAEMVINKWKGFASFQHFGEHTHDPPTPKHTPDERRSDLHHVFQHHPTAGPVELLHGARGATGPGQAVADIHVRYGNIDTIKAEKRAWKATLPLRGGDDFILAFSTFTKENPYFVHNPVFGDVTVIPMQSHFMQSQAVKHTHTEDAVYGMCSDAAHGFFADRNAVLMCTIKYCTEMSCWTPLLFAYSNGQSTEHWKHYFLTLFRNMHNSLGSKLPAKMFPTMMDFSQAESAGFVEAYMQALRELGDDRNEEEVEAEAHSLIKGCLQHYRASIDRLTKDSGLVPHELRREFRQMAMALVDASMDTFKQIQEEIGEKFPVLQPWLAWWTRKETAQKIFSAYKTMDAELDKCMPSTNNAEEAMHFKFYKSVGKHHPLMEGLRCLVRIAETFENSFVRVTSGLPIRYGQAESWKRNKVIYGATKPSRPHFPKRKAFLRRLKNDGRPPDKASTLRQHRRRTQKSPLTSAEGTSGDSDSSSASDSTKEAPMAKRKHSASDTGNANQTAKKLKKQMAIVISDSEKEGTLKTLPRKRRLQDVQSSDEEDHDTGTLPAKKQVKLDISWSDAIKFISNICATPPKFILSYQWENMSCWFDTSFELLFWAVTRDIQSLVAMSPDESCKSGFLLLYQTVAQRLNWMMDSTLTPDQFQELLCTQRGSIREFMHKFLNVNGFTGDVRNSARPLFVSLHLCMPSSFLTI